MHDALNGLWNNVYFLSSDWQPRGTVLSPVNRCHGFTAGGQALVGPASGPWTVKLVSQGLTVHISE